MSGHGELSLYDLARRTGVRVEVIQRLFLFGVVDEVERRSGEPYFTAAAIERIERALRLRRELRIGTSSLGLVLDLLDRIEDLRTQLERR
jgi:hypothetical protein